MSQQERQMTIDELIRISREPNVAAFLRVIRAGESGQSQTAYRMLYGKALFETIAKHPRRAIRSPWGWTSAAGAYQIMARVDGKVKTDTEDWLLAKYGFPDFSPEQQDARAVALIIRRGALAAVRAGALEEAIRLCNREWASLPGAPYGQPLLTLERCRGVYVQFGGRFEPQPAPIVESQPAVVRGAPSGSAAAPAPPRAPEPAPPPAREIDTGELVTSLWAALRAGLKLANSATWKQRQIAINALAALLASGLGISKAFGYEIAVDDDVLLGVGAAVWAVVSLLDAGITAATSTSVGVPRRRDRAQDEHAGPADGHGA